MRIDNDAYSDIDVITMGYLGYDDYGYPEGEGVYVIKNGNGSLTVGCGDPGDENTNNTVYVENAFVEGSWMFLAVTIDDSGNLNVYRQVEGNPMQLIGSGRTNAPRRLSPALRPTGRSSALVGCACNGLSGARRASIGQRPQPGYVPALCPTLCRKRWATG